MRGGLDLWGKVKNSQKPRGSKREKQPGAKNCGIEDDDSAQEVNVQNSLCPGKSRQEGWDSSLSTGSMMRRTEEARSLMGIETECFDKRSRWIRVGNRLDQTEAAARHAVAEARGIRDGFNHARREGFTCL